MRDLRGGMGTASPPNSGEKSPRTIDKGQGDLIDKLIENELLRKYG